MKKTLLLITSIIITTSIVFPQSWKYELDERDGLYYKENSKTPFSGTNYRKWENGKIKEKIGFKKGLRYKYSMYNKNGKKIYEDIIKNNIREETEWYENGKKKNHEFFLLQEEGGSIKTGKWTYWYENGQKKEEKTYKDGKLDGLWTEWYENGQKWYEGTYKDGYRDGIWTSWYESGEKFGKGTYKNGELNGLSTGWYENGQKKLEGTYKDGEKDGLWTYWYDTGEIKREGIFKEGKEIGIWTSWVITDNEFGCFIGLKIKSDDILNYKVLKTIEKISNTLNPNESLFSIINESFYQSNEGFLEIKQMFNDSSSLKLSEIEKQQIIKHTQQRESIRNVLLSLDNSYTTVLINTNTISLDKIERIEETVERYETDDIDIDIYVPSIIQVEGDIKSPSVLQSIEKIKQFLKNNYDVEYSLSLSDHIKDLYSTVLDYDPDFKVIPESRDKINNLLTLYSMSGDPDDFSHLVDYDYTKTNILFYLPDKSELEKSKMVLELMKFIYELTLIEKFNIITYPKKYEYF